MRLIAPGGAPPSDVNKYLLPYEQQVVTVRKHPAVLIGPASLALGGLIAAAVLTDTILRGQSGLTYAIWIVWGVLLLRLLWKTAEWSVSYFIVTSRRLIETSGLITRKVAMIPMVKVTDMTFRRSPLGRLLGYGTFDVESASADQALSTVDHIPYPEQLYLEVCMLLFPGSTDDDPPDQSPRGGGPLENRADD